MPAHAFFTSHPFCPPIIRRKYEYDVKDAVLTMERDMRGGVIPLYRERNPSVFTMCRVAPIIPPEAVPVCILVFTRSKGNPRTVPTMPAARPPSASSPRLTLKGEAGAVGADSCPSDALLLPGA